MDKDEARRILRNAQREQAEAEATWRAQRARMEGNAAIITGVLKIYPELEGEVDDDVFSMPGDDRPKGAEAVRTVLTETPGKWFSVSMVVKELARRGWLPDTDAPANATRAALERLIGADPFDFKKDRGAKTGKVVYAFKGAESHPREVA